MTITKQQVDAWDGEVNAAYKGGFAAGLAAQPASEPLSAFQVHKQAYQRMTDMQAEIDVLKAQLAAAKPHQEPVNDSRADDVAETICRDVAELPDRNSPEYWPEAMLVTHDELKDIVIATLKGLPPAQPAAQPLSMSMFANRKDYEEAMAKSELQPLTDEQIFSIQYDIQYGKGGFTPNRFARAVEAAHGIGSKA